MPASDSVETVCFALLDDCNARADMPASRLYTEHCGSLTCRNKPNFAALLQKLQKALTQGLHAVGMFSYGLGERLQGLTKDERSNSEPLATILLFKNCRHLSSEQVDAWH